MDYIVVVLQTNVDPQPVWVKASSQDNAVSIVAGEVKLKDVMKKPAFLVAGMDEFRQFQFRFIDTGPALEQIE